MIDWDKPNWRINNNERKGKMFKLAAAAACGVAMGVAFALSAA
jgi:hypothetical protein